MNIKTDYETRRNMSQELRDATVEYINDGAKTWLGGGKDGTVPVDVGMWDVTIKDSEDLICIANLLDRPDAEYDASNEASARRPLNSKGWRSSPGKDIEQAFMAASDLDTLVRDVIPVKVWDWMSSVAQEETNEHWAQLDDGAKYNA